MQVGYKQVGYEQVGLPMIDASVSLEAFVELDRKELGHCWKLPRKPIKEHKEI